MNDVKDVKDVNEIGNTHVFYVVHRDAHENGVERQKPKNDSAVDFSYQTENTVKIKRLGGVEMTG